MTYFYMEATILRWVDADTLDVKPLPYRRGIELRVRLKDAWAVELRDPAHAEALAKSVALLGDVGARVILRNTRHVWTYERLECRVDRPADAPPPP